MKLSLLTDNVYLEGPRESMIEQIQTLAEFSKVRGSKISTQKSMTQ